MTETDPPCGSLEAAQTLHRSLVRAALSWNVEPARALATALLTAPLACAPVSAGVEEVLASPAPPRCSTIEYRQKVSASPAQAGKIISYHNKEIIKLNHAMTAMPPCAGEIVHFDGSRILMRDGRTLYLEGATTQKMPSFTTREVKGFYAIDRSTLRDEVTETPSILGQFVRSYQADTIRRDGAVLDVHVGVWKRSSLYAVYVFALEGEKLRSKLLPVLTSRRPIKSVAYKGMPDSPSGILSLAVANSDGSVDLESYSWEHEYFPHMFGMK